MLKLYSSINTTNTVLFWKTVENKMVKKDYSCVDLVEKVINLLTENDLQDVPFTEQSINKDISYVVYRYKYL